ncbi:MAG: hypothetical protein WD049_09215 [Candidatus Paceibacterota bacterium]
MRTLSLVGESLPDGRPVPVGPLDGLVALDARHGVFPNLVMTPILSALWAFDQVKLNPSALWRQVPGLLEGVDRRFNLFNKDTTDPKNPTFEIHPDAEGRLTGFDTATDLWALFGFQTTFGLFRWVLKRDRAATKKQIKSFAIGFLASALERWTPESGLPKALPKNMCAQEGYAHRLCTQDDASGASVLPMLIHAVHRHTSFPEQVDNHVELFRCFVPLLHNEAYQLAPYGVGQANFVLSQDYDVGGDGHAAELYWTVMGKALMRRLKSTNPTTEACAMSAFPNWQDHAVHQRRQQTGCIPTGYEMILRAAGAEGVDLDSFQDDFDLDINLGRGQVEPKNHFGSVASEVHRKYPWVEFDWKQFGTGHDKVAFIDEHLAKKQPVLISLALSSFGGRGWHIMPVVDATDAQYLLLEYVGSDGRVRTRWIDKLEVARIHDEYDGGCEVAFLSKLGEPTSKGESE